jgi:predicted DCC family thiol-disulfide oxidoreductase YuxK
MALPDHIVLFDGVCNLCNGVVQFILRRDHRGRIHFASLQSAFGQAFLKKEGLPSDAFNSFIYIHRGKPFDRSSGFLQLMRDLGGVYRLFTVCLIVPKTLRDGVYNWVASNRYGMFGKRESCYLPEPKWQSRFILDADLTASNTK